MDLDDDELWATQYDNRYIKKSKIEKRIKELEELLEKYMATGTSQWIYQERIEDINNKIKILNEILEM